MIHTRTIYSLSIASLLVMGCSLVDEPDYVKLYKCEKAAYYLNSNTELMQQATSWKSKKLADSPTDRVEAKERLGAINRVMMEAMRGDGGLDRAKLSNWLNSEYCKKTLQEYQEFRVEASKQKEIEVVHKNKELEAAEARQVAIYSISMVDPASKEVSCERFKEQIDVTYNQESMQKYRPELEKGVRLSVKESGYKLKPVHQEYLNTSIESGKLQLIAKNLIQSCPNGSLLSNQIATSEFITSYESPRTTELKEKLKQLSGTKDCGDLAEVYCLSDLKIQTAKIVISGSKKCDAAADLEGACSLPADQIFTNQLRSVELERLQLERAKYERYIANPVGSNLFNSANAQGNIHLLMEKCKAAAVNSGLRGEAYQKHVGDVCEPRAKADFVAPQVAIHKKLMDRISQLGGN